MNKKKIFSTILIVFTIVTVFSVPTIRKKIKTSEQSSLGQVSINNDNLENITFGKVPNLINEKVATTIIFLKPNDKVGQDFLNFFQKSDNLKQLNRKIYLYQMVYKEKNLTSDYNLKDKRVTAIFFEHGKVRYKKEFTQLPSDKNTIITALNTLTLGTQSEK
jgi:hypothetical protein